MYIVHPLKIFFWSSHSYLFKDSKIECCFKNKTEHLLISHFFLFQDNVPYKAPEYGEGLEELDEVYVQVCVPLAYIYGLTFDLWRGAVIYSACCCCGKRKGWCKERGWCLML